MYFSYFHCTIICSIFRLRYAFLLHVFQNTTFFHNISEEEAEEDEEEEEEEDGEETHAKHAWSAARWMLDEHETAQTHFSGAASVLNAGRAGSWPHEAWVHSS